MHSRPEEPSLPLSGRLLVLIGKHDGRVHHDQPPPTPWVATRPRARWARYNADPRLHDLRDLATTAASTGASLPPLYYRYYRWWFAFG